MVKQQVAGERQCSPAGMLQSKRTLPPDLPSVGPQATCLQASDSNYATTEALAWRDDEGEGIIISLWKLMIHSSCADSGREIYGAKHCDLLSVQPIREWPGEPIKVPTRGLPSSLSRANTGELVPRRPVGTALSCCFLPRWIHSNNSCHGYRNYFLTSETPWSQTQSISYMSVFRLLVLLGFFLYSFDELSFLKWSS